MNNSSLIGYKLVANDLIGKREVVKFVVSRWQTRKRRRGWFVERKVTREYSMIIVGNTVYAHSSVVAKIQNASEKEKQRADLQGF